MAVSFPPHPPSLQRRQHQFFQAHCTLGLLLRNAASQQPQSSLAAKPPVGIFFCSRTSISLRVLFRSSWESRLNVVERSESRSRSQAAKDSAGELFRKRARLGMGNMPSEYAEFLKPPKESPNYVLWGLGLLALLIMRKTIITELQRWMHVGMRMVPLSADFAKYGFHLLLKNAREPVVWILTVAGWIWFALTDIYALILDSTPVKALVKAIVFSTAVLSLGEAVQPDILSRQSVALGMATILGLAGVLQLLDPTMFTLALALLTIYLAVFKKAGLVGTALPAAAVLVAVAEPSVQAFAFSLFLALTLYSNSTQQKPKKEMVVEQQKSPIILRIFALAVGIRVVAEWLYTRHIVWLAA